MKLYDYPPSGNGYKARLALAQLGIAYHYIPVDILAGDTRTPEFLARNANGRIPLLQMPDGMVLAESNAILFFLAQGSQLWPDRVWDQAKALQWMFFEQYSHEPNIATARFWISIKKVSPSGPEASLLKQKTEQGYVALGVMEAHLQDHEYFVANRYTVADIALYAYTHMAEEGGFSLEPFPAIQEWLKRVADQPRHVKISEWR